MSEIHNAAIRKRLESAEDEVRVSRILRAEHQGRKCAREWCRREAKFFVIAQSDERRWSFCQGCLWTALDKILLAPMEEYHEEEAREFQTVPCCLSPENAHRVRWAVEGRQGRLVPAPRRHRLLSLHVLGRYERRQDPARALLQDSCERPSLPRGHALAGRGWRAPPERRVAMSERNPRRENWLWWPIEVHIVMGRRIRLPRFLHGPTQHGIAHVNDFKPGGPIKVVVRCWNFGPFCIVFGNDARARRIAGISAGDTPEVLT